MATKAQADQAELDRRAAAKRAQRANAKARATEAAINTPDAVAGLARPDSAPADEEAPLIGTSAVLTLVRPEEAEGDGEANEATGVAATTVVAAATGTVKRDKYALGRQAVQAVFEAMPSDERWTAITGSRLGEFRIALHEAARAAREAAASGTPDLVAAGEAVAASAEALAACHDGNLNFQRRLVRRAMEAEGTISAPAK